MEPPHRLCVEVANPPDLLLHVRLNRFYGPFEGDAMTYRHPDEVPHIRANLDPLNLFRSNRNVRPARVLGAP